MNIADVIEGEGIQLIEKNEYWQGHCPFHADSNPSLFVFKDSNRYHCFGCGNRGDAIEFIRQFKNLSFARSIEYLGISYESKKVLSPHLSLIELIVEEEKNGIPVKEKYKELLIAMGWMIHEK